MCVQVPHLRYVVAAADHSSFRRAATALNLTQPTLSKRIRELEGKLGVPLYGAPLRTPEKIIDAGAMH
jgi:DNA-binding transcriptional LysR family regulator